MENILLHSNNPSVKCKPFLSQVDRLKNMSIRIIALGVTDAVDDDLLKGLVTDETTDYFTADDFDGLSEILDNIVQEVGIFYLDRHHQRFYH